MFYPVVIIGAGPAGLTAAIQLKRSELNPLLLERAQIGGLALNANLIENYPGFPEGVCGKKLIQYFKRHLDKLNIKIIKRDVRRIRITKQGFDLLTNKGLIKAQAVIAASGTKPRTAGIVGEKELFQSNRLFYEVKDLPDYRKNNVFTIIGSGDAAFDYALNLEPKARLINIIFRSKKPKALPLLVKRVREKGNIKLFPNAVPISLKGKGKKSLTVTIHSGNKILSIQSDWVLVAVGREPLINYLPFSLDKAKGLRGLFFAGDVKRGDCRQIGIAVGDGLLAAMQAGKYLDKYK